jgi:hypothetical protein
MRPGWGDGWVIDAGGIGHALRLDTQLWAAFVERFVLRVRIDASE